MIAEAAKPVDHRLTPPSPETVVLQTCDYLVVGRLTPTSVRQVDCGMPVPVLVWYRGSWGLGGKGWYQGTASPPPAPAAGLPRLLRP